jgi:hypothetical protein
VGTPTIFIDIKDGVVRLKAGEDIVCIQQRDLSGMCKSVSACW